MSEEIKNMESTEESFEELLEKSFKTLIHQKAEEENTICISGGKKGYQVELSLDDLKKIVNFTLADIIE